MQWKEKWVGKSTTWWTSKTIKKKVVSLLWRNPSNLAIWSLSFHGQIMCINSFWNVYRVRKKNHTKVFYQNFIKHTGYDKKNIPKSSNNSLWNIQGMTKNTYQSLGWWPGWCEWQPPPLSRRGQRPWWCTLCWGSGPGAGTCFEYRGPPPCFPALDRCHCSTPSTPWRGSWSD